MLDELVERHGIVTWRPIATFCRGAVAARRDSAGNGIAAMRQAIDECRQIGHMSRLPFYIAVLAEALGRRARFQEAEAAIHEAEALALDQNDQWCLPEIRRIHAGLLSAQGRHDDAEVLLRRALDLSAAIGALSWELRAACDLARLWRARSRGAEALRLLRRVLDRFSEGWGTRDHVAAAQLLAELQTGEAPGPEDA
jgi:predicted ATPase